MNNEKEELARLRCIEIQMKLADDIIEYKNSCHHGTVTWDETLKVMEELKHKLSHDIWWVFNP